MRQTPILLACLLALGACAPPGPFLGVAANLGTVPLLGRTPADALYSAFSGRDCSMVNLERGKPWCRDMEEPPKPPAFCTRSLGIVDCWVSEAAQPSPPRRGLADGPDRLTARQEHHRTAPWLSLPGAESQPAPP
jgi:hypothetical protein